MTPDQVLKEFAKAGALLKGHFILSSGLHSDTFLQKALVFQDAKRTAKLARALAAKVKEQVPGGIDAIVSPAVGGIVPGYEMGRAMGLPAMYVERENGVFVLRRGFHLDKTMRVLIVEDIVTTGLSSRECIAAIRRHPGDLVGAACMIDRSGGKADIGLERVSLAVMDIPNYEPTVLPPELAAIPPVKPGSRGL